MVVAASDEDVVGEISDCVVALLRGLHGQPVVLKRRSVSEEGKRRASSSSHARPSPDATNTKLAYLLITSCRMAKKKREN